MYTLQNPDQNNCPTYHNGAGKDALRNLSNSSDTSLIVNGYTITIENRQDDKHKINFTILVKSENSDANEKKIAVELTKPEQSNSVQKSIFSFSDNIESTDSKIFKMLMEEVLKDDIFSLDANQRSHTIQLLKLYGQNWFANTANEYITSTSNDKILLVPSDQYQATIKLNENQKPILHLNTQKNRVIAVNNSDSIVDLDEIATQDIYSVDNYNQIKLDKSEYKTDSGKELKDIIANGPKISQLNNQKLKLNNRIRRNEEKIEKLKNSFWRRVFTWRSVKEYERKNSALRDTVHLLNNEIDRLKKGNAAENKKNTTDMINTQIGSCVDKAASNWLGKEYKNSGLYKDTKHLIESDNSVKQLQGFQKAANSLNCFSKFWGASQTQSLLENTEVLLSDIQQNTVIDYIKSHDKNETKEMKSKILSKALNNMAENTGVSSASLTASEVLTYLLCEKLDILITMQLKNNLQDGGWKQCKGTWYAPKALENKGIITIQDLEPFLNHALEDIYISDCEVFTGSTHSLIP